MLETRILLNKTEFDTFVLQHPNAHYMKTSMWGEFSWKEDHRDYDMLGFYQDDKMIASALVLKGKYLGMHYMYVPKGPCMNYQDETLVQDVFEALKDYAKESKASFLRVDPNVLRCERDIEGNKIQDGENNEWLTDKLVSYGFDHRGYNYAYDGSWTNRYTLIVDLHDSMDEIINRYNKQRKTSLNRHAISGVRTRIGNLDDIPALMDFEKQLSELEGFRPHTEEFFTALLSDFSLNQRLYVTEISLTEMIDGIEKELAGKKYAKDPEARKAKEKDLDRAMELKNKYGDELPIACGLFLYCGINSWDLYTYNHKEFNFIKPVDNLHAFAMEDLKNLGVLYYDMCGFSGVTDRKDPYYGLYAYKKSFGPEFVEMIGQFDYIIDEKTYNRFNRLWSYKSRIRRKWNHMRFQKKERE